MPGEVCFRPPFFLRLLLICFLAARLYRDVVVASFRCFTLCFLCLALLLLLFHGMILSCIIQPKNSFFDHTSDIISYLPLLFRFVVPQNRDNVSMVDAAAKAGSSSNLCKNTYQLYTCYIICIHCT